MNTIFYQQLFSSYFQKPITINEVRPLSGGCINNAVKVVLEEGTFCVKTNKASLYPGMFEREARGLETLRSANVIALPEPLTVGEMNGMQYIVLRFIESAPRNKNFWENFGHSLAALHAHTAAAFGLDFDNYIGSLPQTNGWEEDGVRFFIENRLRPQLKRASENGLADRPLLRDFDRLFLQLPSLLPVAQPSLLHGDLWSGNFMTGPQGEAVLIDPAVYYGSAEAELAFTTLFGGFDPAFYHAYNEVHKLEKGFEARFELYNLYPLLVHVNLFGESYLSGIRKILFAYS